MTDFLIVDHGSVIIVRPMTDSAKDWVLDNVDYDSGTFGFGVPVEPRYFPDLLAGIQDAGFSIN